MEEHNINVKLGDYILDIAAGPFGSNLKVDCFIQRGFPIIDGANLKSYKVTDNITKFVTEEKARSLYRSIAKRNDVVVTISGNVGQISYIPIESQYEEYLVSQRQFRVTFDTERVYVPYLVYYFHTREGQHKILSFANQTGVPALAQPLKNFRNIDISLPDIETQRRIANVIESLDDKIELNNRINHNLEEQAQALYKSWFVDFEPFRGGQFVDSELGMIPEGWKIGKINDVINLLSGFPFKSSDFQENGDYQLITIKGVQDGYLDVTSADMLSSLPSKMPQYCILNIGDILISLTGNVGRICIVDRNNLLLNQRVAILAPKNIRDSFYVYTMFRSESMKDELIHLARGTAQLNLSPIETGEKLTVIPPDSILEAFAKVGKGTFNQYISLKMDNIRLMEMRDSLLPKLMSGELKINDLTC